MRSHKFNTRVQFVLSCKYNIFKSLRPKRVARVDKMNVFFLCLMGSICVDFNMIYPQGGEFTMNSGVSIFVRIRLKLRILRVCLRGNVTHKVAD